MPYTGKKRITKKTQTFAILGVVLALALMPILVESVYADPDSKEAKNAQKAANEEAKFAA